MSASSRRRARRAAGAARASATGIARIHRVARLVARGAPPEEVLRAAHEELTGLLELRDARFETPPYPRELPTIARTGAVTGVAERRCSGRDLELPRDGAALEVLARGHGVGRFVLVPTPGKGASLEQLVVAVAISDQVGAALVPPRHAEPWRTR
ncbi:MAG: hypothetical protein KatS3mg009_2749 [Acidimicrobiia bacterium]|nr:MAG: hypothetical protein KatS3mg009_2749 [Acidimicrobiia bacterium]